jgi:hypothetical protein
MLAPVQLIAATIALVVPVPVSAAPPSAPRCAVRQLTARAGGSGVAAGSELVELAFVNHGPGKCTLYGYPHLRMINADGRPMATTDRDALPGFDSVAKRVVTLSAGGSAWFGVFFPDATGYGTLKCPTATRLRLTPPRLNGAVTLAGDGARIAPYGGSIPHLHCGDVQLTPVTATPLRAARSSA